MVYTNLTEETFNGSIRINGFVRDNNPYYNRAPAGYSNCVSGSPTRNGANVLCNCVGFAWGAFNETWQKGSPSTYKGFTRTFGDGSTIYDKAPSIGLQQVNVNDTPPLGGLIVWKGAANHVAYISAVIDSNTIQIIQSGWGYPKWTQRNNANTGWCNDTLTVTRNQKGKNVWGYYGECAGYVANPGGGYRPSPADYPCNISTVDELSRTQLLIKGNLGGIAGITVDNHLYYKWNSDDASTTNYDGLVPVSTGVIYEDRSYAVYIDKPSSASKIAIRPYQINQGYDNYAGALYVKELTSSIPCINVLNGVQWAQGLPYIFTNGQWKTGIPIVYSQGKWQVIYNNKK